MKLWKYTHVLSDYKTVPIAHPYKTPLIFAETQPDADYLEVTGQEYEDYMVIYEKAKYDEREAQGKAYARYLDARTLSFCKTIIDQAVKQQLVAYIDDMFNAVVIQLALGRWFSAKFEIDKVTLNPDLATLITDNSLTLDQQALIDEVKDRINTAISELY